MARRAARTRPSERQPRWRSCAAIFRSEVRAVIEELKPDGPKAFGAVMKAATARLAGRAEGAQVAAAARKLLGA
ncbi:MAG: hypothetical protein E6J37_04280 [Chloroflexi bacterium]|nr:MAG: hypothetical protein E6J37_04280 [Chloroflexota bacterium]